MERRSFDYGLVIPDKRKKNPVKRKKEDKLVLLKSGSNVWKKIRIRRTG